MREILFRGKRLDNGEWVEGDLFHHSDGKTEIFVPKEVLFAGKYLEGIWRVVDPVTVGQDTSLKDSAGNKIFEGDIVKDIRWGDTYQVHFSEERGGYYPFAQGDGCGCCEQDVVDSDEVVVTGNIHDNPDQFEKKEDKHDAD